LLFDDVFAGNKRAKITVGTKCYKDCLYHFLYCILGLLEQRPEYLNFELANVSESHRCSGFDEALLFTEDSEEAVAVEFIDTVSAFSCES
jgi:hypothetical protein